MGIVLSHPTGSPFASAVARGLINRSFPLEVWTTLGFKEGSNSSKIAALFSDIAKRRVWAPSGCRLKHACVSKEVLRIFTERSGVRSKLGLPSQKMIDWVYTSFDKSVAEKIRGYADLTALYSYEDGAKETFKVGKRLGAKCIYDLPIPHYKKREEILGGEEGFTKEPGWKIDKKDEELLLSDHIFVASSFSRSSLLEIGIPKEKISIVPYGVSLPSKPLERQDDGVFRVLYAGRLESRKGISYLIEAFKSLKLKKAALSLIGINDDPLRFKASPGDGIEVLGPFGLKELELAYTQADLFVFPTLFDGFGLVILEALSFGVPVIATINSGAPDVLTDGKDGFIIPPKRKDKIAEKILWCYENREALRVMRSEARETASRYSWDEYEDQSSEKISELIG